jgi:nucleoside-diphosphate-sugar epimerase
MKNESSDQPTERNKRMKIVVIGGTGLIGSKVVNILRQLGHEVVAASPSTGCEHADG